ncbi:MAG TPA: tetratricopeptide repeat protein [Bryobacteraceae bacterium]|jgi:tetratricopeptide (TPR) repeat protein|nr:tetratricopeptide repeat protein [Bryobacteraceae bacterium]
MYRVLAVILCAVCCVAQSPQELLKQAVTAQQSGRLDDAIQIYQGLLAKYPNIALLRSNLGAALASKGRYAEAITEYNRALKTDPNPEVRLNLALAYYKAGDLDNAIAALKQVHAERPSNLQAITLLADCYLKLGQNKQVVALLTPVEQQYPNEASFTYLLGTALVRDGQTAKGQVIIDKILRQGDSAEARLLMGTTKYMIADFSGARDDFQKAVELKPDLPDVFAYYGLALMTTGDQANAKIAFERELKSNPNNFEANLNLGALLRHDEDYDQALKYLHHALIVRPADPGVRYQIASIELSQGKIQDAERDLEKLVRDSPDFLEAHVTLATVYFREKRKEDGDRERAIFAKLNAERQAKNEIAAKPAQ